MFKNLILASKSPRRRELLIEAGYIFDVFPPDEGLEDKPLLGEQPSDYVKRLAVKKAENVLADIDGVVIARYCSSL